VVTTGLQRWQREGGAHQWRRSILTGIEVHAGRWRLEWCHQGGKELRDLHMRGGRRVRRLGTNGVVETEVERNRDGLPESRREAAVGGRQDERERLLFIAAHHVEQCGPVEGGDGSVRRLGGKAGVHSGGAATMGVVKGTRGGGEGFCPSAAIRVVSWIGRVLVVATRRAWECQRKVPTCA
jgi:hypothetical protein